MMPYGGPQLPQDANRNASGSGLMTARRGRIPMLRSQPSRPPRHWSYVKPVRPALPEVKDAAWCRNPIDHFILQRLEKRGIETSPQAAKSTTAAARLSGFNGSAAVAAGSRCLRSDQSPDAYEKVVDRLLASPHYGERWARQWLDLARYADSNGYEKDRPAQPGSIATG